MRGYPLLALLVLGSTALAWSQDRGPVEERHHQARRLMGSDQYELAIDALKEIIAEHPDYGAAYKSLADAYVFTGDHGNARSTFGADPTNPYALYGLAQVELKEGIPERAIENLKGTIALDPGFLPAYGNDGGLAEAHLGNNDVAGAVNFFAELIAEDASNAYAYYGLGSSHRGAYEWDRALEALDEALRLDPNLTRAHYEKIVVYGSSGQFRNALEESDRLYERASELNQLDMVAYARFAQSNVYFHFGDYWQALEHLNEALTIAQDIGDEHRIGGVLSNLSNIYTLMGDHRKALEFLLAAADLSRRIGDRSGQFLALNNIGNNYLARHDPHGALPYLEDSLALARTQNLRIEEAYALLNLAAAYENHGDRGRAFDAAYESLSISRAVGDQSLTATILSDLGRLKRKEGEYAVAKELLEDAIQIAAESEDVEVLWRARGQLGRVHEEEGDAEGAIAQFAETISLYDAARTRLGVESMEVHFLDKNDIVFPSMIRLLAETGRHEEAFQYAEKFKGASLVALLSQAPGVMDELLPETVRSQWHDLSEKIEAVHEELSREEAIKPGRQEKITALELQVTDLELQQESLIDSVKRDYPSYYGLTRSELLEVEEIRSRHLRPDQSLIEYIVGEDTLSIFVLTQEELAYRSVPVSRTELERLLVELSPLFQKDKPKDAASRKQILNPGLADFSVPPAHALYQRLIEPVESWLDEDTELVIVPDDILYYLPFEVLVADASRVEHRYDFANAKFLLQDYPISYAASASLMDPGLRAAGEASRGVLALGNPDFARREEDRLSEEYLGSVITYSGGVVRGGDLLPLPNAETEVSAIGRSFPNSQFYVGPRASERAFKEEAQEYRVLHLATHFLSDDRQPLYSKIVLAQDEDSNEDGYLQTYEIFNSRLNAELVVLSACNTGLGKLSRGEGLVGISRAFLYAGVPSLVVSLWSVDDEATAVLMESFYQHLLAGASKKQALRQAKLDYLEAADADKRDPFYWAPFILMGEWSPLEAGVRNDTAHSTATILIALVLVAAGAILIGRPLRQ